MSTRSIILVGAGNWGRSWLQFIADSPDWELAGLVSRGGDNLRKAQEKLSIPSGNCFPALEEALKTEGDVVLITAPHSLHVPMALQALEARKHVLIEKPLSDDFGEAVRLVKAASKSEKNAWVVQNFRNREDFYRMRASLSGAQCGNPLSVQVNFRVGGNTRPTRGWQGWRKDQWSFVVNEITIHHFDMARFLLGRDARSVFCQGWRYPWHTSEGPEAVAATIEFEDGVMVQYSGCAGALCGHHTGYEADWVVQTDKGAIQWTREALTWEPAEGESAAVRSDPDFPGFDRAGVLTDLTRALDGVPPAGLPTAEDNLKSLAVVFAAVKSYREQRIVELQEIL